MSASVTIGEFSRLTHLTVKSLRHYHDQGLLTPHAIDPQSGYRRYAVDQAPAAMLIGRLRALDMPLAEVRRVLESADPGERDAVIAEHLLRMERELDRTRAVVASLRDLLSPATTLAVHGRTLAELSVVAITEHVARADIGAWCDRTFTALYTDLLTAGGQPTGPGGALYGEEFFTEAAGSVTAYVPVDPGRATATIPGGRHFVAVHVGPFAEFDLTYAALGSYVAEHGSAGTGPIREIYLVSPPDTTDPAAFRTEVCWPIAA
jgi:DNA-binding transcriptional MerR regulator